MPPKLRMPKIRRALMAADGARRFHQLTDLKLGPSIPRYMDGAREPAYGPEDPRAGWRGFQGYAEAKGAWAVHGAELMAEDPGRSWWAWQQWDEVKVSDLVGGGDAT